MTENLILEEKIQLKKVELETLKEKRNDLESEKISLEEQLATLKSELKTVLFWDYKSMTLTEVEEKKKEINDFLDKHFEKWQELKDSWIIQEIFKEVDEELIS